jgi:2-C-methyl-D-erythritol 4-phosphate cytidylyltransferase
VQLAGRPLVEWSIEAFRAAESVRSIVVACPPGVRPSSRYAAQTANAGDESGIGPHGEGEGVVMVDGGATRAESVANALAAVGTELVAIHDAARPLVSASLIEDVVATLAADPDADGAIAATPVTDTIKRAGHRSAGGSGAGERGERGAAEGGDGEGGDGEGERGAGEGGDGPPAATDITFAMHDMANVMRFVEETLDRSRLWAAQTPQVFRAGALRRALEADPDRATAATDEAMLLEAAGGRVLIHPSPPENLKVTTPHDLRVAELLLAERSAE